MAGAYSFGLKIASLNIVSFLLFAATFYGQSGTYRTKNEHLNFIMLFLIISNCVNARIPVDYAR